VIPPGGVGKIEVSFDSTDRVGEQHKEITVTSNDPLSPTFDVLLQANVEIIFGFALNTLGMGKVSECESFTKSAYLKVKDLQTTQITGITSSSPYVVARAVSNYEAESWNKREIQVTVSPGLPVGRFSAAIILQSNLEDVPQAKLYVSGNIIQSVEIKPGFLTFTIEEPEKMQNGDSKKLHVLNHCSKNNWQITKVHDPDGHLSVTTNLVRENREDELEVTVIPEGLPEKRRHRGSLSISTNDPNQEDIQVKYTLVRSNWKRR